MKIYELVIVTCNFIINVCPQAYVCDPLAVSKSKAIKCTCCVNVYTCLYLNVYIVISFSYCKIFACKRTLYITSKRDY